MKPPSHIACWLAALGAIATILLTVPVVRLGSSAPAGYTTLDMWMVLSPDLVAYEALKVSTALIASWLIVVSAISMALFSRGYETAGAAALRWLPGFLRSAVRGGVFLAVAGTMVASAMSSSAATDADHDIDPAEVAVLIHLGSVEEPTSSAPPPQPDPVSSTTPDTAVMTHVELPTELDGDHDEQPSPVAAPEPLQPDTSAAEWVVEPGEHFWSIAEQILAREFGRAPTDAEIGPYWLDLIESNRENLPDPGNPDLIYPGMRLTLTPTER